MNSTMKKVATPGLLFVLTLSGWAQEPLPAPWTHQDIGAAQVPGTAHHSGGTFILQGTLDIWGTADGCHMAWQPVRDDVDLSACVVTMDNPGGVDHAKASLCIRESTAADARHVTMCVTPTDGTQFLFRGETGGKTTRIYAEEDTEKSFVPKGRFPCWLKLVRQGREFRGYESTDGTNWVLTGRLELSLSPDTVVGLAASSHRADMLTAATFKQVKLAR